MEAHRMDLAALFRTENVPCPADLQVPDRQFKPGSQVGITPDGRDPFPGIAGEDPAFRQEHVRIRLTGPASHTPPELIKFRQPETVGTVDDNSIGIGNIQPGFDDGGTDKDIHFPLDEPAHHIFQFMFVHLAVSDPDPGAGEHHLEL